MLFDPKWKDAEVKAPNRVRDILLKAADLIEERGLAKHVFEAKDGSLCINGALMMADSGSANFGTYNGDHWDNWYRASEVVMAHLGLNGDPAFWNNKPERTKEEVVEALRGAAATV